MDSYFHSVYVVSVSKLLYLLQAIFAGIGSLIFESLKFVSCVLLNILVRLKIFMFVVE